MSEIKLVNLDKEKLELTIASPKDGMEFFGKNSQVIEIVGKINKQGSQVVANNSFVNVNRDGTFVHKLQLVPGENKIQFLAQDKAGNKIEQNINFYTLTSCPRTTNKIKYPSKEEAIVKETVNQGTDKIVLPVLFRDLNK
jgi:hypothetical protein